MKRRRSNSQAGVVLMAVLWLVFVLAAIALALGALVRSGVETMRGRKQQMQAYYEARGAIFRTAVLLVTPAASPGKDGSRAISVPAQLPVIAPGQQQVQWDEPLGHVAVALNDAGGKIDINHASEEVLQKLFAALGLDLRASQVLVDSIADWRDSDTEPRLNGAEDEYYGMLPRPYHAANADFKSIDELLLVRGITPELFYGKWTTTADGRMFRQPGLVDCLTVYTKSQSVNLNYAPYPVLLAIGLVPRAADYVVQVRAVSPFKTVGELAQQFPVTLDGVTLSHLTTTSSGTYELIASGTTPDGVVARIGAVVQMTPPHKSAEEPPFRILQWDDSYVR